MTNNPIHSNIPALLLPWLAVDEFARPVNQLSPKLEWQLSDAYWVTSYGRILSTLRGGSRLATHNGKVGLRHYTGKRSAGYSVAALVMQAFWPGVIRRRYVTRIESPHNGHYWSAIAPLWLRNEYYQRVTALIRLCHGLTDARIGELIHGPNGPLHLHALALVAANRHIRIGENIARNHYGCPQTYYALKLLTGE